MMKERHLHDKAMQMKSDNMFCSQTQNEKLKQLMMLSKLWASFPSLTDWCNRCSLWGEALCPDKGGSHRARACSLSHQPALLSFLTSLSSCPSCVCIHNRSFCLSGQTEKSEEGLINQQLQSKVNKKRWHHNGQWEHLFSERGELQEQIQLSQHR